MVKAFTIRNSNTSKCLFIKFNHSLYTRNSLSNNKFWLIASLCIKIINNIRILSHFSISSNISPPSNLLHHKIINNPSFNSNSIPHNTTQMLPIPSKCNLALDSIRSNQANYPCNLSHPNLISLIPQECLSLNPNLSNSTPSQASPPNSSLKWANSNNPKSLSTTKLLKTLLWTPTLSQSHQLPFLNKIKI